MIRSFNLPWTIAAAVAALKILALLAGAFMRLFLLPGDATFGIAGSRLDVAHVVAILNHVLAAEAVLVVLNLCHNRLL
jgi:hypothetical protein